MPTFLDVLQNLRLIGQQMLRRWYLVLASILACIGGAIVLSNVNGPQYTTVMIIAPADNAGSGMSSAVNALGGGASLLGLVGGSQSPQFDRYVMLLQSESVSEALAKDRHIMGLIFGNSIDPATGQWRQTLGRSIKNVVFAIFGVHREDSPTIDDVQFALNSLLIVDIDPLNKTKATVSCTSKDTSACREIMLAAAAAAQARLDKLSFENAQRMMTYLSNLLASTDDISLKQALTNNMAGEQVQSALASVGQQRAMILDGPGIPSNPSFPKVPFVLSIAALLGLLIGAGLAWIFRQGPRSHAPSTTERTVGGSLEPRGNR